MGDSAVALTAGRGGRGEKGGGGWAKRGGGASGGGRKRWKRDPGGLGWKAGGGGGGGGEGDAVGGEGGMPVSFWTTSRNSFLLML